jgi:hypothetical protein
MQFKEYQKLARRTGIVPSAPGIFENSFYFELMHFEMGIVSEFGELLEQIQLGGLDSVNFKEEYGDLLWYIGNYCEANNLPMQHIAMSRVACPAGEYRYARESINLYQGLSLSMAKKLYNAKNWSHQDVINEIGIFIGKITGMVKKHIIYGIGFDSDCIRRNIGTIIWLIACVCEQNDWLLSDVLDTNIKKLKIRFPDKFTEENALNRDIAKERDILEGNNPKGVIQ